MTGFSCRHCHRTFRRASDLTRHHSHAPVCFAVSCADVTAAAPSAVPLRDAGDSEDSDASSSDTDSVASGDGGRRPDRQGDDGGGDDDDDDDDDDDARFHHPGGDDDGGGGSDSDAALVPELEGPLRHVVERQELIASLLGPGGVPPRQEQTVSDTEMLLARFRLTNNISHENIDALADMCVMLRPPVRRSGLSHSLCLSQFPERSPRRARPRRSQRHARPQFPCFHGGLRQACGEGCGTAHPAHTGA